MKKHFQNRVDETREAYLNALERLQKNNPTHSELVGTSYKINAITIALEAGKSRNPLYNTHKDILDMIHEVKKESSIKVKENKELSQVEILKRKVKNLEEQNIKLLNVNARLMYKLNIKEFK